MKSKMLLLKPNIYLIILILTLFKIFFSTTFSYAESFNIENIDRAINKLYSKNFIRSLKKNKSPYFGKKVSLNIFSILDSFKLKKLNKNKIFFDLKL